LGWLSSDILTDVRLLFHELPRNGSSKKALSMKDLLQSDYCAQMLRILADRERLLIIQSLREGEKTVGEIGANVKEPMGNVSHHLKVLREAGIVESEREGKFVRYRLVDDLIVPSKSGNVDFIDIGCCRLEIPK
jgi:ArsR family transcriptional regulator, nickel/cobalt-responsive transcriptional repressor